MRMTIAAAAACAAWFLLAGPDPAAAQSPQVFPREVVQPPTPTRPGAEADAPAPLALPDAGASAPRSAGPSFVLQGVAFNGSSVYDATRLETLVADKIGAPIDFNGLKEITDRVEALYRADGWLAVRAVIPAQRIQGGRIRVEIVEASISDVVIRGDLAQSEPEIRRILGQLIGQRPISAAATERGLLLARDLPGVNLLAALRPRQSEEPGDLVLLVDGTLTRVDGFASVSNFASEFAGRVVVTGGAAVNSLALSGDRLQAIALGAIDIGEQALGQITYDAPTGVDGLRLKLLASNTVSESGAGLRVLDIDYRSEIVNVGLEYQIIRSRARTLTASGGFEYIHQEANAAFPSLAFDEDLRVFFGGLRLIEPGLAGGLLDATMRLRVGVDALGASSEGDPNLSGTGETDPSFVSWGVEAEYRRPLPEGLALRARVIAQASSGNLPTFERFSLGNYTIGRGFNPGAITGDHGFAGSAELAWRLPLPEIDQITTPEVFGFLEGGQVYSEGPGDAQSLTSVGFGTRWQMFGRLDAEALVAVPVQSSDLVVDDGVRGLFRLTAFF